LIARMLKLLAERALSTPSVLHNYFNDLTKLFSDLYLVKFLDTSAKSFFSCTCANDEQSNEL